ncbi:MAG: ABC transporter permease [Bifidobacteriales bacterium]|uniref:MlaE family ABC transporter permease n=1 Tax=unclassified Bombella TaxID=2644098 RepID=UPI0013C5BB38|nr:ABC transporter permease [Bifidobacteriales bacterium]MUG05407.1 MlaE family lipid ABC transporter permease subunit [Bombella sp. ESL0378]MUG89433.1 MlaE family lipid ABC transporter permease subunit [Bombella sp. ESL0385]
MRLFTLPFIFLGRYILKALHHAGALSLFALRGLAGVFRPPFYGRIILSCLLEIGFLSLPVVALTAIFSGAVIALQSYSGFSQYHAQNAIAGIVVLSITRELGPVLAGLMVAGRIGAAIAAQIGAMRVTDQIDALSTLATNPIKYLVTPRLLAGLLALPFLVLIADILGVSGGFIVAVGKLDFSPALFINTAYNALHAHDVLVGLLKAAVFGFLIALLGCYEGYNSRGGAEGVGRAATATVVAASILILAFDYLLTDLFFTA